MTSLTLRNSAKGVWRRPVRFGDARWAAVAIVAVIGALGTGQARAHCDTMDGPVVKAARQALEAGDVSLVLHWVAKDDEQAVKEAFAKALAVRKLGPEVKELADQFFFETLVRVHRTAEGAPYTGLKPAGTDPGAAVTEADKALESGNVDHLVNLVTDAVAAGIRHRFAAASEKKKQAGRSVEAGREFVRAYVTFVHYAEGLYLTATGTSGEHEHGQAQSHEPARAGPEPIAHDHGTPHSKAKPAVGRRIDVSGPAETRRGDRE